MNPSKERIVHIMACMYECDAEIVLEIDNEECYLFLGLKNNRLEITYEEIECLEQNEIIERDGGFSEEGSERIVYCLTNDAKYKIYKILQNNTTLKLGA